MCIILRIMAFIRFFFAAKTTAKDVFSGDKGEEGMVFKKKTSHS